MSRLRALQVTRFKVIDDAPFDLDNVNVLIGANNSGKSSIMQALHFAVALLQEVELEQKWKGGQTLSLSISQKQLIYTPSDDVYALGPGGRLMEDEDKAIRVVFSLSSGDVVTVSVRKGRNRNVLLKVENATVAKSLAGLTNPFTVFSPGLAGIAKNEQYVSDGVLLRTIARGDANLVLRNTLLRLWNTRGKDGRWSAFLSDLGEVFSDLDLDIQFNQATDEYIMVCVRSGAKVVPLELAGTGVLQTIQILSYIHCFSPTVIVLDEPDSHLHPNNQRLLCTLLRTVSENRSTQILLSTHSRHVVDALAGCANFLWVRKGTVYKASQDDDLPILLDIGALDVKELVANSSTRCIVLTEDERKEGLDTILRASSFLEEQTAVLAYYGCTSPHNLRPLIKTIRGSNPRATIVVHRDRDYLRQDEAAAWAKRIRELGAEPFLTIGVDIESHFLNARHLAETNETLSEVEAETLIDEATEAVREESVQKYVNGRCDLEKKAQTFGKLDLGKLAVEAAKVVSQDDVRFRHSKTVMHKLRELHQKEKGKNLLVRKVTTHLCVPELVTIAKKSMGKPSSQNAGE